MALDTDPAPKAKSPRAKPASVAKRASTAPTRQKRTTGATTNRSRETPGRIRSARDGAHTPGRRDVVGPNAVRVLHGHRQDILGVLFIALGLVTALGVYVDAAGPVGNGLSQFFGGVVGLMRLALPFVFVAIGVVLIRGRLRVHTTPGVPPSDADADGVDDAEQGIRLTLGGMVALIASAGLLHLWAGRPSWQDPIDRFVEAGGLLGWMVGAPLEAALGEIATAIVLLALLVIGVVVTTAMSVALWWRTGARRIGALGGVVQRGWAYLTGLEPAIVGTTATADAPGTNNDSAPIIVGGRQVGEYRRASTKGAAPAQGARTGAAAVAVASPVSNPDASVGDGVSVPVPPRGAVAKATSFRDLAAMDVPDPKPKRKPKVTVSGGGEHVGTEVGPSVANSPWKLPPLALLDTGVARAVDKNSVAEQGQRLEAALASHGVDARLVGMVVGPTVTRFELELGEGVKVARVTSLSRDIAYAMASADVRILAPIPGRQAIGVEVPNVDRQTVALGDLLRSAEAKKATHPLEVAIGRDIQGKAKLMNLAQMPHLLIAGATGSGKSSAINGIITSVLMRSTPADVRMILVDPKMVEMTQYERVPHLLTQPVTDPRKAANALAWACREMDRRYELLAGQGFRDIAGFNAAFDAGKFAEYNAEIEAHPERRPISRLPFILIVVDELADLMMVAARDVEDSICRIAQKARAVGIHLVIATQRPSTNVITGIIKANVPARVAFSVSSLTDSRVILDQGGAERLIGKGDMLMLLPTSSSPDRIQGCWVEESEVRRVVENWRKQADDFKIDETVNEAEIVDGHGGTAAATGDGVGGGDDAGTDDDLYVQARDLVISSQLGSTSMLQRKLKVGFAAPAASWTCSRTTVSSDPRSDRRPATF